MNALCAFCPFNDRCSNDETAQLKQEKAEWVQERSILRERLIENGLEAGASILMHGQRIDTKA
ncbi:MAG: hypothetical protein CVU71_03595 [Deltaproteobacteria bacterium HGW-Deltaproteobacteria-6]|jgi:hypothetical protein|nr:MAG: hypothetical protein CVU71_03595 [Deltaproteobacteria bacterium HGW-Deltaproteobacteria-6]